MSGQDGSQAFPGRRHRFLVPLLLFGLFFPVYSLLSTGTLHNPDSGTRMYTAVTLARRGSIEVRDSDFPGVQLGSLEFGRNRHGLWVEMFNEGQSLLLAPFLAPLVHLADAKGVPVKKPAEFVTAAVLFPAFSALTIMGFWFLLGLFGGGVRDRLLACFVLGLGTPALVFASNGHHEMQLALLVMAAFGTQTLYLRGRSRGWLALTGALLGVIVLFRYSSGPLAVLWVLWLGWELRRGDRTWGSIAADVALLTSVAILCYSPQLYFNWVKTGNPMQLPIVLWDRDPAWVMSLPQTEGLAITLFSPAESIFLYHPILLVSLCLLPWMLRPLVREGFWPLLAYACVFYLMVLGWIAWRAEISWGPRTLVHLGFLAVIPAWMALRDRISAWIPGAVMAALALGTAINFLGTLYPAELDFGAQRVAPVYGEQAEPAWVNYPAWRARDLAAVLGGQGTHVPTRFRSLSDSSSWFVPQWWCVRLFQRADYGVPRPAVALAVGLLGAMALFCSAGLLRVYTANPSHHPTGVRANASASCGGTGGSE